MKYLLLLILLLSGCRAAGPPPQVVEADKRAEESLADKSKTAPALAWLANTSTHNLWKGDRASIKKHFEELTRAGAPAITAVDLEDLEGHQICASFVVTLPSGPGARKELIGLHNAFWKGLIGEADAETLQEYTATDEGQHYLFYNFDL